MLVLAVLVTSMLQFTSNANTKYFDTSALPWSGEEITISPNVPPGPDLADLADGWIRTH